MLFRKEEKTTLKSQILVDKNTRRTICTAFTKGKRHEFRLFKESKTKMNPGIQVITDAGYQGIQKLHSKSELPKKKIKKNPLTKEDKKKNQALACERVANIPSAKVPCCERPFFSKIEQIKRVK